MVVLSYRRETHENNKKPRAIARGFDLLEGSVSESDSTTNPNADMMFELLLDLFAQFHRLILQMFVEVVHLDFHMIKGRML